MMKFITIALTLSAALSGTETEAAGLLLTAYDMPHHKASADVAIWYPDGGGGTETTYAGNAVFVGIEASMEPTVKPGRHPIVLFSHGMGGTDRAQAWLASELADRGAIVVSVNHPHSSWGSFDMAEGVKHWTRALDLSVALDRLLEDPRFADTIDTSRIMAAGFSYGGWTALSLGGATGNHAGIVEACTKQIDSMQACDLLMSDEVGMQRLDAETWNADYSDPRVTQVVAVDPGFVWGLEAENVAALVPQTLLIGLGGPNDRMSALDFDQSGLAALLPGARVLHLKPAFHFTVMPICTSEGAAILREENDDPVCTDPAGTDRAAVHAAIVDAISEMLEL